MKIPGVIILYNPDLVEVISNIASYIESLDVLYVFDNSENGVQNKIELENNFLKIKYYSFYENKGIAFALNFILQIAFESQYKWILTMDQDSYFSHSDSFKDYITSFQNDLNHEVALFCPMYSGEKLNEEQFYTSGTLMNLKVWMKIGKFDEKLFIDEVDGDFTFRLTEASYKLKKIYSCQLIHKLGDKCCRKFLGKNLYSDNHSALRKYYIARNRLYLIKKNPSKRLIYLSDSFFKFIIFILVESDKKRKLLFILRGIYDGLTNKMGKYKNKYV